MFERSNLVAVAIIALVILPATGCLQSEKHFVRESIKITIQTNWSGNYYLYLPIKVEGHSSTDLSKSIKFVNGAGSVEIIDSGRGLALNVTTSGSVNLSGEDEWQGGRLNESYLDYGWSPHGDANDAWQHNLMVFVSNETTDDSISLQIEYSAESNYCSTTSQFSGIFNFNGTWNQIQGFGEAVCT